MKPFNVVTTLLALSGAIAGSAQAQVTFSGQLETVMPEVKITAMERPVSHVKDFYLELDKDAIECDLKTIEWQAQNTYLEGAKPLCFFEWTGTVNGLVANDLLLEGILDTDATVSFGYTVSVLNNAEKTLLITDEYTVDVESPELPLIIDAIAKWSDGETTGLEQDSYGRMRQLRGVEVKVEPRPFQQKLMLDGKECVVDIDEESCFLSADSIIPGDGVPEEVGAMVKQIEVLDVKEYLTPELETFTVNYDYRSPAVETFIVNGVGEMAPIVHDVAGVEFTLEENEALLVLSTPHSDKSGDWWFPKVRDLRLKVLGEGSTGREMLVNGKNVMFPTNTAIPNSLYRIYEKGEHQQIDQFTVIRYDINNLPDGDYEADIIATDSFNNIREEKVADKLVDRNAPSIVGLLGDVQMRPSSPIETYFLDDVFFAAYGGWVDGTNITSVTRDGNAVDFTRINEKVVHLNSSGSYSADEIITYLVEAEDQNGNVTSEEFKLTFNPAKFRMVNVPSSVYEYVHEMDIGFYQVGGARCYIAATPELATALSTSVQKGCTVDFPNLPDGLNVINRGRSFAIEGALGAQGDYDIEYAVTYYNTDGSSIEVSSDAASVTTVETPALAIQMTDLNMISEGLYSVPHDSKKITKMLFDRVNGQVDLTMEKNPDTGEQLYRAGKRKRFSNESYFVERLGDSGGDLWTQATYTAKIGYPRLAGSEVEQTFDVVVTPSSRTRSYVTMSLGTDATTVDTASVQVNVGRYDTRRNTYDYDIATMGGWTAELAVDTVDGLVTVSDVYDVDAQGQVVFDMPAQDIFDQGDRYVAIIKSKSSILGFEREIHSRSLRVKVLKGSAIEGLIKDAVITDEIPFRSALRYEYASREDQEVIGELAWQVSLDDANWSDIPNTADERFYIETTQPSENFYRLKTINKYTDVVSHSNSVKIMGYELMSYELQGPRKLIRNQMGEFTVVENAALIGAPDGTYEYSTDNGVTWTEFMDSFEFGASTNFVINVRNRLDSTSLEAGEDSYSELRYLVKVVEASPVKPDLENIRFAESNFPLTIEGSVRTGNSGVESNIISEIVLPNGDVIEGLTHEYTVQESDIVSGNTTFTLRAWVENFKTQTYAEDTIIVPTKTYEFPDGNFFVSTYYALAPSDIDADIRGITTDVRGVEFTYEWVIDDDAFDIERMTEDKVSIVAKASGVHVLSVIVRDNRGNEQTYSEFVTIETTSPMIVNYEGEVDKENYRAPLTVDVKTDVELGHRKDGVATHDWYLNDVLQDSSAKYETIYVAEEGEHEIRVVVTSNFGQVGTYTQNYSVLPNLPPSCSPAIRMRDQNRYVAHNCEDPDGKIMFVRYGWGTASKLNVIREEYFSNTSHPSAEVTITAVDDGGEEVTYTVSW